MTVALALLGISVNNVALILLRSCASCVNAVALTLLRVYV